MCVREREIAISGRNDWGIQGRGGGRVLIFSESIIALPCDSIYNEGALKVLRGRVFDIGPADCKVAVGVSVFRRMESR